jgi:hypothetical protein
MSCTPFARLAAALGCALVVSTGCSDRRTDQLTFVIAANDVPQRARDAWVQRHGPADTLRLTLPGKRFEPPLELHTIPRDSVDRSTPLGAEAADFSAFKAADENWIIQGFADADRREVLSFLSDSAIREGSRHMFEPFQRVRVYAVARDSVGEIGYQLVFFSYFDSVSQGNMHAYVLERGEWKRTNQLARDRDPDATLAFTAFRFGRIEVP